MSVLKGFMILLMAAFLVYMCYRLILRRKTTTLIVIFFEIMSITTALLSFFENVDTNNGIELFFICFGLIVPASFFSFDYYKMISRFKEHKSYNGFVEAIPRNQDKENENNLRVGEGLNTYAGELDNNPDDYTLYYNLGITLYEMGRYSEAAESYRKALKIYPEESEVKCHLAAALIEQKKYPEAAEIYKDVLKANAEDSEIYYNLSMVYSYLKKMDIAIDNLKMAIELNTDLRLDARTNRAFDSIKNSSDFKEIVA